jgi:multidrug transporter EmrE-like cation transporter
MSAYAAVALTVVLTVYGQLVVKWQTSKLGEFPDASGERWRYLGDFFINPWIISVLALFAVAAACWVVAVSKLDLSRAYPFLSASFVLVLFGSAIFFGEAITATKVTGALLIVAGLVVGSQSL